MQHLCYNLYLTPTATFLQHPPQESKFKTKSAHNDIERKSETSIEVKTAKSGFDLSDVSSEQRRHSDLTLLFASLRCYFSFIFEVFVMELVKHPQIHQQYFP